MAPPKPKIPAEYAAASKKLLTETTGMDFDMELDQLAMSLKSNIKERSEPLAADAMQTVKAAGIFNRTISDEDIKFNNSFKNPIYPTANKTPDVKSSADFEVGMDELLANFKEPKAVEGSGVKKPVEDTQKYMTGSYRGVVVKYDDRTGVLMGDSAGMYTPEQEYPSNYQYPLSPKAGDIKADQVRTENALLNERPDNELAHPLTEFQKPEYLSRLTENIPGVAAVAGAGVLLSSQNAQAKELNLDQELQPEYSGTSPITPKVDLLKKARNIPSGTLTENGNTSTIIDEISNLAARAKHNLGAFAKDVSNQYGQYQAEKDALNIRAQEMFNGIEANTGHMLSDEDKALLATELQLKAGSPLVSAAAEVDSVNAEVSKFNQEVVQPLIKTMQVYERARTEPIREVLQKYAPSLAVLADTAAYPLVGTTGWNIPLNTINNTNSDEEINKGLNNLVPEARKLLDDKATLLGTDGGKALLALANGYAELPMWLLGGGSKVGLMIGGIANELFVEDSKDSDLGRGAVIGLAGGKVMETVIGPITKKAIDLLGKVKLSPGGVMDAFGKVTFDDNAKHVQKVWQALFNKNAIDPMLMMTGKTATMMADDAAMKVRPDVSEAFQTKVIAPQALVLGIEPATGKPKLYGVKDGLYGELTDFVNPEGRPVIINQIAKDEWMQNEALRDTWNKLIDPKRKTPATTKHGIDEWTPDVIPPENPALVFAWKQFADGKGATELYRAGSRDFAKDLLRSRELVRVEFTGPDGRPTSGLGFWGAGGDVVFAPDASDGIPGAIPKDLTFKQVRMNPNVPASGIPEQNQAWEIHQLDDTQMYALVDEIKATQALQRDAAAETARGGMMADGVPTPDKRPPNEFDVDVNTMAPALAAAGGILADSPNATAAAAATIVAFLPPAKQAIGKALAKMNNAAGKLKLISDTVYGEVFKIDASIQAFSLRHYERLTNDLNKQLIDQFRNVKGNTPLAHKQFDDQLRYYIENHKVNAPAPLPPQLNGVIQQKVQKYVAERNADYAVIQSLGGTVPDNAPGGNAELEKLFALEYFNDKKVSNFQKIKNVMAGNKSTGNEWIDRMRTEQHVPNSLIDLIGSKEVTRATKNMGQYDQVMGRMSTEKEMAKDYMKRKLDISRLGFMQELSKNTLASSSVANQALGHVKQVEHLDAGLLKGKWVSEETYNAIYTYPEDQKMLQNTMLGMVNMIKFNKTVLNPTTWVKNIMGNVWGTMNSNIVPSWRMMDRMPHGMNVMRKDLAKFNADVMANDASVHRVHETLKFGLLGNEFESSRSAMQEVLSNLAEPMAATSNRTWGEKLASFGFTAKDKTLGGLAHVYSKVDMATKYSLYVNGLERWGIDLATNKLRSGAQGRKMVADLLGANVANNFTIDNDMLTEMAKREIVRRIHLSLPMVDRIGPIPTALNKLSPVTNPWLRTASELTRITLQMPYRMFNEKGYAVNSLKTASFLGTILGVNKAIRLSEGISDEMVDDAKRIAPSNVKNYMPGATATKFYAGEGKDRGLVYFDMANGLVEPAQWFKGGEINNGTDAANRLGANTIDLVMGGGLLQEESKDIQAALGLADSAQNYSIPFWKQGDTMRFVKQKALSAGPAFINSAWQLYANEYLPRKQTLKGQEELRQPMSNVILKSLGIPVATMGTENQKNYKLAQLSAQRKSILAQIRSAGKQTPGSSTGALQDTFDPVKVQATLEAELKRIDEEESKIMQSKTVKEGSSNLLTKDNLLTPHL